MFLFISTGEIVFLLFAVLMLFGTDKLPEIARMAAKTIKMVRNASNDLKAEITKAADADPTLKDAKEAVKEIKDSIDDTVGRLK
ncbi:MAG: twin-arginine translocase TatA/TatE family subunit [Schleiferiaceae bacterium]|nr:twin-arginine translocase TatA/TatE family subunit [Schleiferiaceae bacterium]